MGVVPDQAAEAFIAWCTSSSIFDVMADSSPATTANSRPAPRARRGHLRVERDDAGVLGDGLDVGQHAAQLLARRRGLRGGEVLVHQRDLVQHGQQRRGAGDQFVEQRRCARSVGVHAVLRPPGEVDEGTDGLLATRRTEVHVLELIAEQARHGAVAFHQRVVRFEERGQGPARQRHRPVVPLLREHRVQHDPLRREAPPARQVDQRAVELARRPWGGGGGGGRGTRPGGGLRLSKVQHGCLPCGGSRGPAHGWGG